MRPVIFFALLLLTCISTTAQDLTGTWEGSGGSGAPYLKIVLVRCGDNYFGYTYDEAGRTFCRTDFEGTWDQANKRLSGSSTRFIGSSNGHMLCRYTFFFREREGRPELDGTVRAKSAAATILTLGTATMAYLRRKSTSVDTTDFMRRAIEMCNRKPDTTQPAPPIVVAPPTIAPPVVVAPAIPDSVAALHKLRDTRRTDTVQTIETKSTRLLLRIFDNGIFDGDVVSILYNNRIIADHHTVTVKPLELSVDLKPGETVHDITIIAHNVGRVAPNTASVIVEAGDQKYHVRASTDLQRNAVIRIVYRP
ncbi:MAG: hypothetical protein EOO15_04700 [Chitinophagaceae bacterium]|nr:MAG: hypothetical protein EOO15_04700 [Chitinophagaceae bacterium]